MTSKWDPKERHQCHDCGIWEGELHHRGCDMERCPFCLGQLIACGCCYRHFYPTYNDRLVHDLETQYKEARAAGFPVAVPFHGLPEEVYNNGMPDGQAEEWEHLLDTKGRIPYIVTPNMCARCGETWPEMFMVEEWQDIVPADLQREMLCRGCYEVVKSFILLGRAQHISTCDHEE